MRPTLRLLLPITLGSLVLSLHAQNPLQAPPAPQGNGPATVPSVPVPPPDPNAQPDFPKVDDVLKGYEKVVRTTHVAARAGCFLLWSRHSSNLKFRTLM